MTVSDRLARFLELNPYSEVRASREGFRVQKPWGDDTLALQAKEPRVEEVADVLNRLVLPRRFTALYHTEAGRVEFIWSLLGPDEPIIGRDFRFALGTEQFTCRWAEASEELVLLAEHFVPTGPPSNTNYRNLPSVVRPPQEHLPADVRDLVETLRPVSFWLDPVPTLDEQDLAWVAKHLNVYIEYYDRRSPVIVVHPADQPQVPHAQLPQMEAAFPTHIASRHLDPLLLELLAAARDVTEPRLKFIYYFQILEHASYYAIDEGVRREIIHLLRSPDTQVNAEDYVVRILDKMAGLKTADEHRLMKVVQARASADRVWAEVSNSLDYFTASQTFDGGFVVEPLVSPDTTLDTFKVMWLSKTCDCLRWIRNALVHGRESRANVVIAPTAGNDRLLWPWVSLIRRIAEDVVIYRD